MPDGGDADWPRRFLVVYDRLPGGTGYLHRLASADGFREVLLRAREVIESCPCIEKGMDGCHRCLLRRVPASDYDRVSRNEVRQMLDELLGKTGESWKTSPVAATHHIPLERQAESDLEVMFIETLKEWAKHPDSRASADAYTTTAGTYSLDLRLTGADGATLSWRVSQQRALDGTRPDVLFERLDAPGPRLALYLDGYEFHATPKHNRLADDATKRTRLRAEGLRVFQLTYLDVKEWRTRVRDTGYAAAGPTDPVWQPYGDLGTQQARKYYDEVRGGLPGELAHTVWINPADLLLSYLRSPDADAWLARAEAVVAGLTGTRPQMAAVSEEAVGTQLTAALQGTPPQGRGGPLRILAAVDRSGCSVTAVADGRHKPPAWTAATVLDDSSAAVADTDAHRKRWRAWLYWSNLLQFLEYGGGDSAQLTSSLLDGFSADALAVTGGSGWLASTRIDLGTGAEEGTARQDFREAPEAAPTVAESSESAPRGTAWDTVLEYLDPDEPGLQLLAVALASMEAPAPVDGFELDDRGWMAELAWPDPKVGVVLAPRPIGSEPDYEAQDRDAAFASAGWDVRPASAWTARELAERLAVQPAASGRHRDRQEDGTTGTTHGEPHR